MIIGVLVRVIEVVMNFGRKICFVRLEFEMFIRYLKYDVKKVFRI